jgi:hypothetical protein
LKQSLLDDGVVPLREDAHRRLAQGRHRIGDQVVQRVLVGRLVRSEAVHLEGGAAQHPQRGLAHCGAVVAVLHDGNQRLDVLISAADGGRQPAQHLDARFLWKRRVGQDRHRRLFIQLGVNLLRRGTRGPAGLGGRREFR